MNSMKLLLLCSVVNSLSMVACVAGDPDADISNEEEVGEGSEALCPLISMPSAQATRVVSGAGTYDDEYVAAPSAQSYTVDFTMPAGKPQMYGAGVWAEAIPSTQAQCQSASISVSIWRKDSVTGCWSALSSKTVNGTWTSGPGTLFPCTFGGSLSDVGVAVPSNTSALKVKATAKLGTTVKRVGVRAGWSEPADAPR